MIDDILTKLVEDIGKAGPSIQAALDRAFKMNSEDLESYDQIIALRDAAQAMLDGQIIGDDPNAFWYLAGELEQLRRNQKTNDR